MTRRIGWALPGLAVLALAALAPQRAGAAASNWAAGLAATSTTQARGGTLGTSTPSATCSGLIGTTVNLAWAAVPGATSYAVIQTRTPPLSSPVTTTIANVSATSYENTGLGAGNYTFQIQASAGTKWLGAVSGSSAQRSISIGLVCT